MKKQNIKLAILLFILGFSLQSCEFYEDTPSIDPNASNLTVYTYGALSQNARPDILVSLHWTLEEAENNQNPIDGRRYTDEYGEVTFFNLPPDERFYVRAKPLVFKTIRETSYLYRGNNYIDVPVP